MTYKSFDLEIENKIAHIQLCRPDEFNTMNPAFWNEFPKAIRRINEESLARVIVLSSTGKHFCAGMDLAVFSGGLLRDAELGRKHENLRQVVLQLQEVFTLLEKVRIPVLAAIQGGCIGGAVDMVAACDSRYCTQDAFFSIEETKLAMTADLGTLQRLPKVMSSGLVRELAFTGRRMFAEEAKGSGLVNNVFETQEAMLLAVMETASQIAQRSPLAVAGCKEMLNYGRDHSVSDSLNYMSVWQAGMFQPQADMMEAFTAKAQKRDANFDELCTIESPIKEK